MIKWLKSLFASKFDPGPNNEDCTINVKIESGFSKEDFEAAIRQTLTERYPTPTTRYGKDYVCAWSIPLSLEEIVQLNKGVSPLVIAPEHIKYYRREK